MTGFDGDPGKKLLVPKGKVDLAPNSDGETAQAFGQAADNSFGMAANKKTYNCGANGWCSGSDGSVFPPNSDGNFPDQSATPVRVAAADDNRLTVETPKEAAEDDRLYDDFLATNRTDGRGSLPSGRTYFSIPGVPLGQGGVPLTGGLGNIGGGEALEPDVINGALEWLGPGYRELLLVSIDQPTAHGSSE